MVSLRAVKGLVKGHTAREQVSRTMTGSFRLLTMCLAVHNSHLLLICQPSGIH